MLKFNKISKEDKILNLVQYRRGYRGPVLSIIAIISRSYVEPNSADRLKAYPTCLIDRMLQERKINFTKDTPMQEKILDIELHDSGGMSSDDPKRKKITKNV